MGTVTKMNHRSFIVSVFNMTDQELQTRKWIRRKEARPMEIVDAALDLFVEKGFVATKMEDIARRAGVTKGTPYLYFANKEEIFKEVVRTSFGQHLTEGEEFVRTFEGSSADLLVASMRKWWGWVGNSRLSGIPKLMMAEAGNFPELAKFYGEEVILRGNRVLETILNRGIAAGEFRQMDVEYTVSVIIGPMLKALMWKHSFGCCGLGQVDMERYLNCYFEVILNGIAAKTPIK